MPQWTRVSYAPTLARFLRPLVLQLLRKGDMTWRRHGVGMLQGYVHEGGDVETRVHIWHPSLEREGIFDRGDIHSHRFDLTSVVIAGALYHQEVHLRASTEGEYGLFEVVNARKDLGARYRLIDAHRYWQIHSDDPIHLREDDRYTFDRGAFHRSWCQELAITVVQKTNQIDAKAKILSKARRKRSTGSWAPEEPVHAFEKDDNVDTEKYVRMACKLLEVDV